MHKWYEWFLAQQNYEIEVDHTDLLHWMPPLNDWLKCNVDADFNRHLGTRNRGWCLRNNLGNFVIANATLDDGTLTAIEAEALALK